MSLACSADPGSAAWSIPVRAEQGKFAGGSATVGAYADTYVCGEFECFYDSVSVGPLSIRLGR